VLIFRRHAVKKLGVGIIGLGIISDAHEKGVVDAGDIADLIAVCDINREKAESMGKKHNAAVYTDYRDLLADPMVEVVDIILPHHLHYQVAKDCIDAGKHILIEKPLALSSSNGADLIDRANRKGIIFSVAENTRFVTAYLEVERILASGELGKILSVRTLISGSEIYRLTNDQTWKGKKEGSGGGVLMDAAPHTFYLLKWLFGGIDILQAFENQLISQSEVEDNAIVIGTLKNSILFYSQFSFTVQAPWTERLEINGCNGSIIIDQISNPVGMLFTGSNDFYGRKLDIPYDPENWKFNSIATEVAEFLRTVVNSGKPAVDALDANYAVYAVEKAYESSKTGKRIVL
jgi:predicted dehydrogenase